MLGAALSAYEHWLADESVSLGQALGDAFDTVSDGLGRAGPETRREKICDCGVGVRRCEATIRV